ncbi:hypothetical protein DV735_g4949, partial [Chaetothyriales sp. CBS 134920]
MLKSWIGSRACIIARSLPRFASTQPARPQTRRLEVERKFLATPVAISYLRSNEGSRFQKHESLGRQTTHDTYYDRDGLLFSRGVYVRRRNGHWEAKVRTGGDYLNSAFTEVDGVGAVKEVIKQNLADAAVARESWMLDGRFKVDIDTTDFGHTVGEVELTATLGDNDSEAGQEDEEKLKEKMDQDITAFMQSHPQAFPAGRPLGKLSAYFDKLSREK